MENFIFCAVFKNFGNLVLKKSDQQPVNQKTMTEALTWSCKCPCISIKRGHPVSIDIKK